MNYLVITAETPQQVQQDNDHFIVGSLIVLAVCAVIVLLILVVVIGGAEDREAKRAREALKAADRRRYLLEQSWVDTNEWPLTHYDVYPTAWEFTEDLTRLKAMGYDVEWQEHLDEGVAVTYSLTPAYERESRQRRQRQRRQADEAEEEEEEQGAYSS
jgi:hypothetical protein